MSTHRDISLRKRILATLVVTLGLQLLLLLVSWISTASIQAYNAEQERITLAEKAALRFQYHVSQVQQFLTDVSATAIEDGFAEADAHYADGVALLADIGRIQPDMAAEVDRLGQAFAALRETGIEMARAYIDDGREAGNVIMKRNQTGFDARSATLIETLEPFLATLQEQSSALTTLVETRIHQTRQLIIGIELAVLLIVAIILFRLRNRVFDLLGGEPALATRVVDAITAGNLNQTVVPEYGGKHSLLACVERMRLRLGEFVSTTHSAIGRVDGVAGELAASASQLTASAHQTSESASDMARAVHSLTQSLEEVAQRAEAARDTSASSGELAERGRNVIGATVAEMHRIEAVTSTAATSLAELDGAATEITRVIQMIKEVADQTNLLALNAAIEAARAGESGRGFAVVADEVRKLAERTALATQEIHQLVSRVNSTVERAIGDIDQVVERVNAGVDHAGSADETMQRIYTQAQDVMHIVHEISAALHDQERAHDALETKVQTLAQVSERNSSEAKRAAGSARQMHQLSDELRGVVSWMNVSR